jgi:hypothetical protein
LPKFEKSSLWWEIEFTFKRVENTMHSKRCFPQPLCETQRLSNYPQLVTSLGLLLKIPVFHFWINPNWLACRLKQSSLSWFPAPGKKNKAIASFKLSQTVTVAEFF